MSIKVISLVSFLALSVHCASHELDLDSAESLHYEYGRHYDYGHHHYPHHPYEGHGYAHKYGLIQA